MDSVYSFELNKGLAFHNQQKFTKAEKIYRSILKKYANNDVCLHLLGVLCSQTGRHVEAVSFISRAIILNSNVYEYFVNIGHAYRCINEYEKAILNYSKAINLNNDINIFFHIGVCHYELKNFNESEKLFISSLNLNPYDVQSILMIGKINFEVKKDYLVSLEYFQKANLLDSNSDVIFFYIGLTFYEMGQYIKAIDYFNKSINIKKTIDSYMALGKLYFLLNKIDQALNNFKIAYDLDKNKTNYDILVHIGYCHEYKCENDIALNYFQLATEINPNCKVEYLSSILNNKMILCDWSDLDNLTKDIFNKIINENYFISPLVLLNITDDNAILIKNSNSLIQNNFELNLISEFNCHNNKKIKIGYFSPDFRLHPVSYLTAGIYEKHDRKKFEIYAFSFGFNTYDEMRVRLENSFDHFIDVSEMSALDIAKLSRMHSIDIAIDLCGHTQGNRMNIFAYGAAPIQINYLGFPGSTGAFYYDYIIADRILIPIDEANYYSENIISLPFYQSNDHKRSDEGKVFNRSDFNIPENVIVICSFNNSFKINKDLFEAWIYILLNTSDAILWLYSDSDKAFYNLLSYAVSKGINKNRIIHAQKMSYSDHLSRLKVADLFLDTFPFNGGTTVSDALWAGLPVVSLYGRSYSSRMAKSLLHNINVPELSVSNLNSYKDLAIKLCSDKNLLYSYKNKIFNNFRDLSSFNIDNFISNLEKSYFTAHINYINGQKLNINIT